MPGTPGGRLARLSRERAQPGAIIALGDGCFRATAVLPHHAAWLRAYPNSLLKIWCCWLLTRRALGAAWMFHETMIPRTGSLKPAVV